MWPRCQKYTVKTERLYKTISDVVWLMLEEYLSYETTQFIIAILDIAFRDRLINFDLFRVTFQGQTF